MPWRYPGPKPKLDDTATFQQLVEVFVAAVGNAPVIGTLIEIITGVEDGDTNDLGTWVNNLRNFLQGKPVTGDTGGWFSGIGQVGQNIIDTIFGGYHGTTTTGHTVEDLSMTMANVDNRITALEGGGMLLSLTSSTTVDISDYATVKVIMMGSSLPGGSGGYDGGAGGRHGGFLAMELSTEYLASLGINLSAVEVQVGTSGNPSRFGKYMSGSGERWVMETTPGTEAIAGDMRAFVPTAERTMGNGGAGGAGYRNNEPAVPGQAGGQTILGGLGGAGGSASNGSNGGHGGHGSVANIDGPIKGGGSGGGGGGGGDTTVGSGRNGGNGGNGAFPGGGPGGGGGRGRNTFDGSQGQSGAVANGYVEIEAR